METEALIVRTWDDLVFRNRNREYGAYPLRKSYSRRVLLGAGFSAALMSAFLLFMGTVSDNFCKIKPPVLPKLDVKEFLSPPVFEPRIKPPQRVNDQPRSTNTNTTVRVVDNDVPTQVTEPTEDVSFNGTTEGTEGGVVEGSTTGTDLPIVADVPKGPVSWAEVMPKYEGGVDEMMKFIKRKIRYPNSAKSIAIEGTVYVSFIVNGDGTVTDVAVVRGFHPKCDEEAMRVISMLPDWIGGSQGGVPVAVRMILPIKFSLSETGK